MTTSQATRTRRSGRRPGGPVLLVDVGGVLLLHNHDLLAPITSRFGGVSTVQDFQRAHYAAHNASRPARGPQADYFELFPAYAGIPADRQDAFEREYRAFHRTRNMCHWPDPAAKATLARLVDDGVPIAVVSQADGTIARMLLDAEMCQNGDGPACRWTPSSIVRSSAMTNLTRVCS